MCTPECFKWAAKNLNQTDVAGKRVLEVGAFDVNGSLRYVVEMLKPAEYIGTDIAPGPGVDLICPADLLVEKFGENSFDLVISCCVLEHIRDWRTAVSNIKRVCKPAGVLLVIVPCVWVYHAHPGDFWRYTGEDLRAIFSDFTAENIEQDPVPPSNSYGRFVKPTAFTEKNLAAYELLSIVTGTRIRDLSDADYHSLNFLKTLAKFKAKTTGLNLAHKIFRQV